MKDLIVIEQRPEIPDDWDYNESVAKVKQIIYSWKNLTWELATELSIARDALAKPGRPYGRHTWKEYCEEIGHHQNVVNNWIDRWFLTSRKIEVKSLSLPTVKYQTITIDPPWPIAKIERAERPMQTKDYSFDYPTMTIEEIKDMAIPDIMADNCHIYLWTTQKYLPISFEILEGWEAKYIFTMVWHKSGGIQPFKLPQYNCEFVLFGRKGNLDFLTTQAFSTCFVGKRREHSRKPNEFYDLVRRVSPEPRVDIFAREKHDGFEQYGDEVNKFNGT